VQSFGHFTLLLFLLSLMVPAPSYSAQVGNHSATSSSQAPQVAPAILSADVRADANDAWSPQFQLPYASV
jgi:hypothetical protein